ncbi:MAG: mechanosensitive ion channel [Porticoccaceae bacterium]|nr:mechanosensitive ion channel [Pseudomonadales bacterium]MCP5171931.1 mechanosensitive ion channel [Pseudomonadales bacterium]
MAESNEAFDWPGALAETYQELARQIMDYLPQILGAVLLLLVGWLVAALLRMFARKLILGFELLLLRTAEKRGSQSLQVRSYARLVGDLVFWSVLLFFVAASANMLDWKIFSGVASSLLIYLPNVLMGLLIILAGFPLSGVARSTVARAAESTGINQSDLIARTAQVSVVLTAILIGVEQLGINVAFLTTTLIVTAGVLLGGAALAFGLGARHFIANVIGVQTARKHYQLGQLVRIDDIEGYVLDITPTVVVLDTRQGRALVPAKLFHEQVSKIIVESSGSKGVPVEKPFDDKRGDHVPS